MLLVSLIGVCLAVIKRYVLLLSHSWLVCELGRLHHNNTPGIELLLELGLLFSRLINSLCRNKLISVSLSSLLTRGNLLMNCWRHLLRYIRLLLYKYGLVLRVIHNRLCVLDLYGYKCLLRLRLDYLLLGDSLLLLVGSVRTLLLLYEFLLGTVHSK